MPTKAIQIDSKLYESISDYCKYNNLKISEFCTSLLKKSFNIEKFGDIPFGSIENINVEPIKKKETINSVNIEENNNIITPINTNNSTAINTNSNETTTTKPKKRRL